jgi:hypothetical protein
VDACAGATCPHGQTCTGGACVDLPDGGPGGFVDTGVVPNDTGLAGMDGGGSALDAGRVDGGPRRPVASGGCCRVIASRRPDGALVLVALVVGVLVRRRGRR